MKVTVKKYNIYDKKITETEIRRAQTVCLYYKKQEPFEVIAEITSYALSTVKAYVNKYSYMTAEYDAYFNEAAPAKTYNARTPLPYFEDEYIKVEIPAECGLYLVGSTHFDPITGKRYFWIKVGMSKNLKNRLRGYHSENPMIFVADVLPVDDSIVYDMETDCHVMLSDVAKANAENTAEWFLVDESTYMEICNKGFGYFFTVK